MFLVQIVNSREDHTPAQKTLLMIELETPLEPELSDHDRHPVGSVIGTGIGAVSGAFMGTALGGPFGTIMGAIIGGFGGTVVGYTIAEEENPSGKGALLLERAPKAADLHLTELSTLEQTNN